MSYFEVWTLVAVQIALEGVAAKKNKKIKFKVSLKTTQ